ncbi:Regulator of chromosome condensation (RCC1) repeat protein [compost metagenome]
MNRLVVRHLMYRRDETAFALPTVLIASVIMLSVLLVSVTAVSSIRTALNEQYYNQIAMEAGEAGTAMATACLRQNNYDPIWLSNPDPTKRVLKPNTLCNGNLNTGASSYVIDDASVKTSFTVSDATVDVSGFVRVRAEGLLQLMRTSNSSSIWKIYQQTAYGQSNYVDNPQIASGAGWKSGGHNGYMLASNGVLYAWGSNSSRQVGDPSLGTSVGSPTKVDPPAGTTKIKRVYDSGQGASILCVLAGDNQIYCRGSGGLGGLTWQRFGLAAGLTAVDMDMSGYGSDAACVIASDGQVYCAGMNDFGMLGNGQTVNNFIPMTAPTRFLLPAGVTAKKVFIKDWLTCVITATDDAYCAGVNNLGQTGRGNSSINVGNGNSNPARVAMPAGTAVKDIKLTYHGSYVGIYYLGSDGAVYMSGHNGEGTANDGNTTYTTYYATPRRTTTPGYQYASIFSIGQDGNDNSSLCMIREDPNPGMTWCIGNNDYGQLGDGTCTDRGNWVVFGLPAGEAAIRTMNRESGYQMNSFMVITESGRVFAAGDNRAGKTSASSSSALQPCNGSPVEIVMPFRAGSATERVRAVALANSDEYTAFILGDNGIVYSLGLNGNGQLGKGNVDAGVTFSGDTLTSAGSPAKVPTSIIMPRISVSF